MPKMDEIRYHLGKFNKQDIFGICETYLNENIYDNDWKIENFVLKRNDQMEETEGV
jgi:hypothetical protein